MDEEDELALKLINAKLPSNQTHITEDQFEEVMNFFEEAAQTKQPYAVVDSPPVLSLDELQDHFDDTHPEYLRALSRIVYDHWALQRNSNSNKGLSPHLKFETGQESDDSDPYVCFRRRELRQVRKTRNRDLQSADKLRKLRIELEHARNLLNFVKRREQTRKESIEIDRMVFEQRHAFRETKRKLGMKGDEELLINQKKQKVAQGMTPNQAALAQQFRMPGMAHGASSNDLRPLEDVLGEKQRSIQQEISINVEKHGRWNEGYVDNTKSPLTPEHDPESIPGGFRKAMAANYLPTPPASQSEDENQTGNDAQLDQAKGASRSSTPFRYASPADDSDGGFQKKNMGLYRRRVGRGGRVVIDRKLPVLSRTRDDRFKYDTDNSDSEDEVPSHTADADRIALRSLLAAPQRMPDPASASIARRMTQHQLEAVAASTSAAVTASTS